MKTGPLILPPDCHPVQVFLSAELQVGNVLERLLEFTGPARLTVSTFSTGEEFLRQLVRLRASGSVKSSVLYLDHKAAVKTARILPLARSAFDHIRFCSNHSKIMVMAGENCTVSVLTSQNQTRGNRMESYVIIHGEEMAATLTAALNGMQHFDL